jgi:predicted CXXCH cytochrome family protein
MKERAWSRKIVLMTGLLSILLCIAFGSTAWAMIPLGSDCGDCHDVHGGGGGWLLKAEYAGSDGCITCHSSSTSSTTYVLDPGDYLAGGNFWWVSESGGADDGKGHNIFTGEDDDRFTGPPGNANACATPGSCHVDLNTESTLYGTRYGCLGCHMMRNGYPTNFHHADDECDERVAGDCVPGTEIYVVGETLNDDDGYYRFLTGHFAGEARGVCGIEDDDWEATVSSTDHNEYLGNEQDLNLLTSFSLHGNTTTAFCAGCHGNFHLASVYPTGKPDDVIIDNGSASYVGTWDLASDTTDFYGTDYQYHAAGSGSNTATWTPDLLEDNTYNVYAWWSADTDRATNAQYTIDDCGGACHSPDPVVVDQTVDGGQWNLLGTYEFLEGTGGSVSLSDDADGKVIADAIKFESAKYVWERHPVGMALPTDGDMDFYNYTEFNPAVPVGRTDLTGWTGPSSTVTPGEDVINCLSCHRAHGSEHKRHLRWDPTAPGASGSCATCHISKAAESVDYYLCENIDDCNSCHTSHGQSDRPGTPEEFGPALNQRLVWNIIFSPVEEVYRDVTFPIYDANGSLFVRNASPWDGICEACHTLTTYYRNDGTGVAHYGGPSSGHECTECHYHEQEFLGPMPDDAPHNMHMGISLGGLHGPQVQDCTDCHTITEHSLAEMVAAGSCDNCHSPGGGYDGVNDATVGAANNWFSMVREPDGSITPGKEKWCAGCHDDVPANSHADGGGIDAPPVAGDGTTWGFYVTGHGRAPIDHECIECHDESFQHIDDIHRTYTFDDTDTGGAVGPDMYDYTNSGVAYAAGYRLKYIGAEVPLMIPNDFRITYAYNYSQHETEAYRLCLSGGCHSRNKIFDNTPVADQHATNFMASGGIPHEEYPLKYSHVWGNGGDINDHVSHILHYIGTYWDSDWDYATTGTDAAPGSGADSNIACSSCHNVHGSVGIEGSTNEAMIRNGNLTGRGGYGFSYLVEDTGAGGYPMVTSTGATQATSIGAVFRNDSGDMCIGCHGNKLVTTTSYDASDGGVRWGYDTYLEYYRTYVDILALPDP